MTCDDDVEMVDKPGKNSKEKSSDDDGSHNKDLGALKVAENELPKDFGKKFFDFALYPLLASP